MKAYPEAPDGLDIVHDGPVLRLKLNRPKRRNSITDPIVWALIETIDAAGSDESVRVVELTGEGDHFCSGFDLGERTPGPDRPRVGSIHRRRHDSLIPRFFAILAIGYSRIRASSRARRRNSGDLAPVIHEVG